MKKNNGKFVLALLLLLVMVFFCTACGSNTGQKEPVKKDVKLSYVEWDTEIASTNVIAEVLRQAGYSVEITPLDNAVMWQAVATGQSDGMVAAWLPSTHHTQYEKYSKDIVDLGANLVGAKIGLVVPEYMKVASISELKDEADKKITGIEPGAGVVAKAEGAVREYPNLKDWEVTTSSSGAMVTALGQAIKDKKEIIITGWSPHWMFATYKLKYLEDPNHIFGGEEEIHTIVRKDLQKDMPQVYRILDQFHWSVSDIESVMMDISKGMKPEDAAKKWIKEHPEQVAEWTNEIENKN